MLEDAVYYSRREADERALAAGARDPRVQEVHLLLAEKYLQLAHREMAGIDTAQAADTLSIPAESLSSLKRASRGTR
jgi:hypothetical protein